MNKKKIRSHTVSDFLYMGDYLHVSPGSLYRFRTSWTIHCLAFFAEFLGCFRPQTKRDSTKNEKQHQNGPGESNNKQVHSHDWRYEPARDHDIPVVAKVTTEVFARLGHKPPCGQNMESRGAGAQSIVTAIWTNPRPVEHVREQALYYIQDCQPP